MSIIIDLVIIAIIALCVLVGYHKGLTGSLLKIVSFVLALIIAFILFKPVSNFIIDKTDWDENLEQAILILILSSFLFLFSSSSFVSIYSPFSKIFYNLNNNKNLAK